MEQNHKKKRRIKLSDIVLVVLVLLVAADQICVRLADRAIRITPDFFETVLERADLSLKTTAESGSYFYQSCEFHRVLLFYKAKTCFSRSGGTNPTRYGDNRELMQFFYWPPLSKTFSFFAGYYYEEPCCNEMLMYVTRENQIIEDFRK